MLSAPENCPESLKDIITSLDFSSLSSAFLKQAQSIYPYQIMNVWHQLHEMSLQNKLPKDGRKFRVLSIGSGLGLEVAAIIAFCKIHDVTPEFFLVDTKELTVDTALKIYQSQENINIICCDGAAPEVMEQHGISNEFDMIIFRHPPILSLNPQREFSRNAFLKTIPYFMSNNGILLVSCYDQFEMREVKAFYKSNGLDPATEALVNMPFKDLRREYEVSIQTHDPLKKGYPESYNIVVTFSKAIWQNRLGYLLRIAAAKGNYRSLDLGGSLKPFCFVSLLNLNASEFMNSAGNETLKTALHQACSFSNKDQTDHYFAIISALLKQKADTTCKDSFDRLPLYYFELKAPKNHPKYAETLIALGGVKNICLDNKTVNVEPVAGITSQSHKTKHHKRKR